MPRVKAFSLHQSKPKHVTSNIKKRSVLEERGTDFKPLEMLVMIPLKGPSMGSLHAAD